MRKFLPVQLVQKFQIMCDHQIIIYKKALPHGTKAVALKLS